MTRPPNPAPSRPPWQCSHAAVAGLKHRRAGRPTQDACLASATGPYPFLIVCDGRGSATRSDLGAQASVEAIAAVIGSATDLLAACLDSTDDGQAETVFALLARLLCRTAAAAQERLARHHRQEARAFEHTLLVACLGRHRLGWVQVGDGGMVVQRHGVTEHIGATDHHEFANLTEFVTAAAPLQGLHCGMVPTTGIAGIAGFTDGTAARMLRSSDRLPAPAFAGLWKTLRQGDLTDADLARFLLRPDWEPSVTDDRSLALLANATTAAMTPAAGPEPHTAATPPAEAACHNAQPGEAPPAPEPAPAERPPLPGTGLIPPP